MSTPDIEEELNVLARFIGRAVGVAGDLDALEALTKVKHHLNEDSQALREIKQLVLHEWRVKDHAPGIVLNSIEQVLDALAYEEESA